MKADERDISKLNKNHPAMWWKRWSAEDLSVPGKAEKAFKMSRKDKEILRRIRNRHKNRTKT